MPIPRRPQDQRRSGPWSPFPRSEQKALSRSALPSQTGVFLLPPKRNPQSSKSPKSRFPEVRLLAARAKNSKIRAETGMPRQQARNAAHPRRLGSPNIEIFAAQPSPDKSLRARPPNNLDASSLRERTPVIGPR